MTTIRLYLDTRGTSGNIAYPLKISLRQKNHTTYIPVGITIPPEKWSRQEQKIIDHPLAQEFNYSIAQKLLTIQAELLKREVSALPLKKLRQHLVGALYPETVQRDDHLFTYRIERFARLKTRRRTRELYLSTLSRVRAFDRNADSRGFEDITVGWLNEFDAFMAKTAPSPNARAIHLRNIRAVFNDAITDEITTHYPFRKFRIKRIATAKRALSVEQLRQLFDYDCNPEQRQYVDMFKLSFFLIAINIGDLCLLKGIEGDRIEYHRQKTGRFYSVKVEPEALEIIERYRGRKRWLLNILDRYQDYRNYANRLNRELRRIGSYELGAYNKKIYDPMFPKLTTYWVRHTWASIAAELEIPKETIAAALGHGGDTITDIYIDFDQRKVDEANRKVIDWVLYNKNPRRE